MTFTWTGDPAASDVEAVRFELQDTTSTDALLTDEEIEYALDEEASVLLAAARCAEVISRKFGRDFDFTADGVRVDKGKRAQHYRELAADLRARAAAPSSGIQVVQSRMTDGYEPAWSSTDVADRTALWD